MTALDILRKGGDFRQYGSAAPRAQASPDDLKKARQVATMAARLLKEEFGATRVVLYGSLARREGFDRDSDIDLAVWGIPDDVFYAAVSRLDQIDSDWEINLESGQEGTPFGAALTRDGIDL